MSGKVKVLLALVLVLLALKLLTGSDAPEETEYDEA